MTSELAFETVNNLFQDISKSDELLSGDFRQILPIVRYGNRKQIIQNCIKKVNYGIILYHFI